MCKFGVAGCVWLCVMAAGLWGCTMGEVPSVAAGGRVVNGGAAVVQEAQDALEADVVQGSTGFPENVVVAYLWDVEVQFDTPEQGYEICRALVDMSTLSAGELSVRRYADHMGRPQQLSIIGMLRMYFVPAVQVPLGRFFMDVEKPEAREVVRQTLADISGYCGEPVQEQAAPVRQGAW